MLQRVSTFLLGCVNFRKTLYIYINMKPQCPQVYLADVVEFLRYCPVRGDLIVRICIHRVAYCFWMCECARGRLFVWYGRTWRRSMTGQADPTDNGFHTCFRKPQCPQRYLWEENWQAIKGLCRSVIKSSRQTARYSPPSSPPPPLQPRTPPLALRGKLQQYCDRRR